ncbi:2-C-methyl-D-erythritol 4-phosphate cytidylyltransferase [Patescibacteria group bacterium]|nr:2-C-methyl-D-erythritol 4-phosphate cytidylyltransferase [Patescibacteria group bacterium]
MKITAIILAAGRGTRMNAKTNKVFLTLNQPIIAHTIRAFEKNPNITDIIIVTNPSEKQNIQNIISNQSFQKISKIISGGETRQESCYNGVMSTKPDTDIIIIHDGARPFIRQETIDQSISDCQQYDVSVVGVPVKDTIKTADSNQFIEKTLDRSKLWAVQTPQVFMSSIIKKAHQQALADKFIGTDDTSLAERIGYKVKITPGHYDNIKITTPDDLIVAKNILSQNSQEFN